MGRGHEHGIPRRIPRWGRLLRLNARTVEGEVQPTENLDGFGQCGFYVLRARHVAPDGERSVFVTALVKALQGLANAVVLDALDLGVFLTKLVP